MAEGDGRAEVTFAEGEGSTDEVTLAEGSGRTEVAFAEGVGSAEAVALLDGEADAEGSVMLPVSMGSSVQLPVEVGTSVELPETEGSSVELPVGLGSSVELLETVGSVSGRVVAEGTTDESEAEALPVGWGSRVMVTLTVVHDVVYVVLMPSSLSSTLVDGAGVGSAEASAEDSVAEG